MRKWCLMFGIPRVIASDGGGEFCSSIFQGFCETFAIRHEVSAGEAHWANGQVDRHHDTLRRIVSKSKDHVTLEGYRLNLEERIALALLAKNQTPGTNGWSPYNLVFGKSPNLPLSIEDGDPQMGDPLSHRDNAGEEYGRGLIQDLAYARANYHLCDNEQRIARALQHQHGGEGTDTPMGSEVLYWRNPTTKGQAAWRGPGK